VVIGIELFRLTITFFCSIHRLGTSSLLSLSTPFFLPFSSTAAKKLHKTLTASKQKPGSQKHRLCIISPHRTQTPYRTQCITTSDESKEKTKKKRTLKEINSADMLLTLVRCHGKKESKRDKEKDK
jgi:hypothetical protein